MKKILLLVLLLQQGLVFAQNQTITRVESVQSLYIEVFRDSLFLGKATGFVIKSNTQNYLITNWHVATNKNPSTKNWINPKIPISPNLIAITHNGIKLGDYVDWFGFYSSPLKKDFLTCATIYTKWPRILPKLARLEKHMTSVYDNAKKELLEKAHPRTVFKLLTRHIAI